MPTTKPRITITLDPDIYQQIQEIANKRGLSMSDIIRQLLDISINTKITTENIDFLSNIMREQLRNILKPYMTRILSLESKTCIQAATSSYLCAETLNRFVPPNLRLDVEEAYRKAQNKAIRYVKSKTELDTDE